MFEEAGKYKQDPITTYKHAKAIYMFLTPLRFLLKAETCPEVLKLDAKTEERADNSIYFLPLFVTKRIHKILGLTERFSAEQIQVCQLKYFSINLFNLMFFPGGLWHFRYKLL